MKERRIVSVNAVSKNEAIAALEFMISVIKDREYSGSVIESVDVVSEGGENNEAF